LETNEDDDDFDSRPNDALSRERKRDITGKVHRELPTLKRTVGEIPERRRESILLVGDE